MFVCMKVRVSVKSVSKYVLYIVMMTGIPWLRNIILLIDFLLISVTILNTATIFHSIVVIIIWVSSAEIVTLSNLYD